MDFYLILLSRLCPRSCGLTTCLFQDTGRLASVFYTFRITLLALFLFDYPQVQHASTPIGYLKELLNCHWLLLLELQTCCVPLGPENRCRRRQLWNKTRARKEPMIIWLMWHQGIAVNALRHMINAEFREDCCFCLPRIEESIPHRF
jgi:hypothetical protein